MPGAHADGEEEGAQRREKRDAIRVRAQQPLGELDEIVEAPGDLQRGGGGDHREDDQHDRDRRLGGRSAEEEDQQRDSEAAYQPERDPTPANAEEDGGEHHRKLNPEEHVELPSLGSCRSALARPRSASSATSGGGGPRPQTLHESVAAITASVTGGAGAVTEGYSVVGEMSVVPFALKEIRLAITTPARPSRTASPSSRHRGAGAAPGEDPALPAIRRRCSSRRRRTPSPR